MLRQLMSNFMHPQLLLFLLVRFQQFFLAGLLQFYDLRVVFWSREGGFFWPFERIRVLRLCTCWGGKLGMEACSMGDVQSDLCILYFLLCLTGGLFSFQLLEIFLVLFFLLLLVPRLLLRVGLFVEPLENILF